MRGTSVVVTDRDTTTHPLAAIAQRATEQLAAALAARVSLDRDRARATELATEGRPVIEALIEGLASAERVDPNAGELREAMTLASLLGRRAGILELTPSAALEIVPSLVDAVADAGHPEVRELAGPLSAVCIEGYVAAREERLDERAARRAADAIALVAVAPRCFALFVAGDQDADELERVIDEVGRTLLDRDARALVVHAAGLKNPDRERARRLLSVEATCRMLGVACVFSAVGPDWQEAAREAGLEPEELTFAPSFDAGLDRALETCGLVLEERGGVLRRLVRSRKR